MAKVETPIDGEYKRENNVLTGAFYILLITETLRKPHLKLLDITDQVNHTGKPSYISGLFKANTSDLREVYNLDYKGYYYSLIVDKNTAEIVKKGTKNSKP